MRSRPQPKVSETGQDGLTYHVLNRRNLAAGEKVDIGIRYAKTDTGLSAPQLAVAQTGAAGDHRPDPSAATRVMNWLPWLLIGLGLVLLVADPGLLVVYPSGADPRCKRIQREAPVRPQDVTARRFGPQRPPGTTGRSRQLLHQLRPRPQGRRPLLLAVRCATPL